ncbi:MAG: hypothetical protein HYR95_01965 [Candidatus Colwellbacteria bacterium]|nr:hypothetical protein [Candidatus Colwellbacteria bacterium]
MKKKLNRLERTLLITGSLTLVLTAVGVIYSLGFLSNNLLRALRPETDSSENSIEFDIKGFESLGL